MNLSDRRERDQLVKQLRRQVPGEMRVKPTTPELMRELTVGIQDEYTNGSEQRANATRLLFTDEKGMER